MPTYTATDTLAALLAESHGRIRVSIAVAVALAEPTSTDPREIAEAAERVRRFFGEAFAAHAADEELSILPRLAGRDRDVDAALVSMHRDHEHQRLAVERLVTLCEALAREPMRHAELSPALTGAAAALRDHLADHLEREEAVVFPALRLVPEDVARQVVAEIHGRRAQGAAPPDAGQSSR
jgi:hemerythrin-like domain-containing protein